MVLSTCLLNLYASVLVPVFSEWLDAERLCRLDTAVCSSTLRRRFLTLLSKCCQGRSGDNTHIEWICERGIKLRSFESDACSLSTLERLALSSVSTLEKVAIDDINVLKEVLRLCPVVHSIKFSTLSDRQIAEVLPCMRGLCCLSISGMMDQQVVDLIANLFPMLKELSVDTEASELIERCQELEYVEAPFSAATVHSLRSSSCKKSISLTCKFISQIITDDSIMPLLDNCATLTSLSVGYGLLTDVVGVAVAQNCPHLTHLSMLPNTISDATLVALTQHCPYLRHLSVDSANVTDHGILALVHGCHLLTSLDCGASCKSITDIAVTVVLQSCKNLIRLYVNSIRVSDQVYKDALTMCPTLQHIAFFDLHPKAGYRAVFSKIPSMTRCALNPNSCILGHQVTDPDIKLYFGSSSGFNTTDLEKILLQSPSLTRFAVEKRFDFTWSSLDLLIRHCPLLTNISLVSTPIPVSWLSNLFAAYPALHSLEFSSNLADRTSKPLVDAPMTALQRLKLHGCYGLSDSNIEEFFHFCPNLSSFSLSGNGDVTGACLSNLLKTHIHLMCISVLYCSKVGVELLDSIVENGRPMREAHFAFCTSQKDAERLVPLLEVLVKNVLVEFECD